MEKPEIIVVDVTFGDFGVNGAVRLVYGDDEVEKLRGLFKALLFKFQNDRCEKCQGKYDLIDLCEVCRALK